MNLLGLVFSIILILSFSCYACFDKQLTGHRLRTIYLSHQKTNRKMLNSYQSKVYQDCRGKANRNQNSNSTLKEDEDEDKIEEEVDILPKDLNRECARINLWPLVQEGRESHPTLYELTAKLIRDFYAPIQSDRKRFEYYFLDLLLSSIKESLQDSNPLALEKISLPDPEIQKKYYHMLKGTKQWDLASNIGYPPLLDYIKLTPSGGKICISHAHLDLLSVLFNKEAAQKLFNEIHKKDKPALTVELIETICSEKRLIGLDKNLLALLEFNYPVHQENKKIFVAEDTSSGIFLRKNIYLKSR